MTRFHRMVCLALIAFAGTASAVFSQTIANGGFEHGLRRWSVSGPAVIDHATFRSGTASAKLPGANLQQTIDGCQAGKVYSVSAWYRAADIQPAAGQRGYGYLAVYQWDEFGDLAAYQDFAQVTGTTGWKRATFTFTADRDATSLDFRAGIFQAAGTLWIDAVCIAAGTVAPEFTAQPSPSHAAIPGYEKSPRGTVGILRDTVPPLPDSAPSDPTVLAAVVRAAGMAPVFLTCEQFADPNILTPDLFTAVILPYGTFFPAAAADTFRDYLRSGGNFISIGGYAFDALKNRVNGNWVDPTPPPPPQPEEVRWRCRLSAAELRAHGPITFEGWIRTLNVRGEHFAFYAVYQYDHSGKLVTFKDISQLTGTHDWEKVSYVFDVDPRAERVELHAGLYRCKGVAWFDDVKLTDAAGRRIAAWDFEQPFDPHSAAPGNWQSPDDQLAFVTDRGAHGGSHALKCRLRFFQRAEERLNTRKGVPRDGLEVAPTQLPIFDADYRLQHVAYIASAPQSGIFATPIKLTGDFAGYAAVGVTAASGTEWEPLLNAYDRDGRLRGAAAAIMRHTAGPYAGSTWIYCGVNNTDLFTAGNAERLLTPMLERLASDAYFVTVTPGEPCYFNGERQTVTAEIRNAGAAGKFTAALTEGVWSQSREAAVGSFETGTVEFALPESADPVRELKVTLSRDGRQLDERPVVVLHWTREATLQAPDVELRANRLHYGSRPLFSFGTDDYSRAFHEQPAQWLTDFVKRRDYGVTLYENLQIDLPQSDAQEKTFFRQVRGMQLLATRYRQIFFPCLLCGFDVAVDDATLEKQAAFCGRYAKELDDVPGMIYYLNGDLRCRPGPQVKDEWNRFLKERYGTDAALRAAWGALAPTQNIGDIPCQLYGSSDWTDVRAYDFQLFRTWLIRRWTSRLIQAIHASAPDALTTCEFYKLPVDGVDIPDALGNLSLSNIGYFDKPLDDLRNLPGYLLHADQRVFGKGMGLGEYGVKTHPAWGDGKDYGYHTARTQEQAKDYFLSLPHIVLGLGGTHINNWCWKDASDAIFPWGMVNCGDETPKDILRVHRDVSLLFRQFDPGQQTPQVYVMTPDSNRLGAEGMKVMDATRRCYDILLGTHVDGVGTLNEHHLVIPATARVIFAPVPFILRENAYQALLEWVRKGGVLYVSGDLSYDETRKPVRAARLEELCGVRRLAEWYPNLHWDGTTPVTAKTQGAAGGVEWQAYPAINIQPVTAQTVAAAGNQVIFTRQSFGSGTIFFNADPMEFHTPLDQLAPAVALYRQVLGAADIHPQSILPDSPRLHLYRLPTTDGGTIAIVMNYDETVPAQSVSFSVGSHSVRLDVAKWHPGLVWFDAAGKLRAVEGQGLITVDGQPVLEATAHTLCYSVLAEDLRSASAVMLMPLESCLLRWRAGPLAQEKEIVVGTIRNGAWVDLETMTAGTEAGGAFRVDPVQALNPLLLAQAEKRNMARRRTAFAMTQPQLTPGKPITVPGIGQVMPEMFER